MPSPTIRSHFPSSARRAISFALSAGDSCAFQSRMPSVSASCDTVTGRSPDIRAISNPRADSVSITCSASWRGASRKTNRTAARPGSRNHISGPATWLDRSAFSVMPQNARLPSRTMPPGSSADNPCPGCSETLAIGVTFPAARTRARDSGWVLLAAMEAASSSDPSFSVLLINSGLPVVNVPVLSKMTPRMLVSLSSAVADLTRIPARNSRPVAIT